MKTQVISKKHQSFYPSSGVAIGGNSVVINNTNNDVTTNNEFIVDVVVTSNITLSATQTIDGITLIVGQKVLVTGQTSAVNNGVYIVQSGVWVRTFDLYSTMLIKVREGTLGANSVWMLSSPDTEINIGTDNITFIRIDNAFIPSNVTIQSASGMRTALGLGTMAVQNSNNVSITGGFFNITGSNSQINVGQLSGYTLRTSSTGTGQLMNAAGSSYMRHVSGERFEFLSNTASSNPFTLELNSNSNTAPLLNLLRDRTSGNSTQATRTRVNTTSSLHIFDSILDEWNITPTTGVAVNNQIAHIVTNASATVPDTAMQVSLTIAGALKRVLRLVDRGIQIWNASTHAVRLLVSSSLAVSYDLILPTTAPSAGQIMTHDGTGQQFFENHVYTCLQLVNSNITMQNNYHYCTFDDTATRRQLLLPSNANSRVGVYIRVTRSQYNTDTFRITQSAGQSIYSDALNSTEGVTGYLDSTSTDTSVLLMCMATDQSTFTRWQVVCKVGTFVLN